MVHGLCSGLCFLRTRTHDYAYAAGHSLSHVYNLDLVGPASIVSTNRPSSKSMTMTSATSRVPSIGPGSEFDSLHRAREFFAASHGEAQGLTPCTGAARGLPRWISSKSLPYYFPLTLIPIDLILIKCLMA